MGRMGYRNDFRQNDRDRGGERGGNSTDGPVSKYSGGGSPAHSAQGQRGGGMEQSFVGHGGGANSHQAFVGSDFEKDIDKKLSGLQTHFSQELQKINVKENEKFDLIFAILSELQTRQAALEETVRSLKVQHGGGQMVSSGTTPANMSQSSQQQGQFSGNGMFSNGGQQAYNQMGSPMNGQMQGQQFTSVMQADGTQAHFTAVPQMVVVSSPTNNGMQYAMPQQMLQPMGCQPMQQVAMQFVGSGQDGGCYGSNGQDATAGGGGAGGQNFQAQLPWSNDEPKKPDSAESQAEAITAPE